MAVYACAPFCAAVHSRAQLCMAVHSCSHLCAAVHSCSRLCVQQTRGRWVSRCEGATTVGKFQRVGSGEGGAGWGRGHGGGSQAPPAPAHPQLIKKTPQTKPRNNNGSIRGAGAQRAGSFPARTGACCHVIISLGISWPSPFSLAPPWTLGQYLQGSPGLPLQHHNGVSPKSSERAPGVRGTASGAPCALAMGRWASSHAWGSWGTSPTCDGRYEKEETLWAAPTWERLQGAGERDWGPPLPISQCRQQPREELPKASSCFCSSLPLICRNQIFCAWNKDAHAPTRVLYPQTKTCSSGCLTTSRPCLTRAPEQRWGSTGEEKPSLHTAESPEILPGAVSPPYSAKGSSVAAAKSGATGIAPIFWCSLAGGAS